MEKFVAQGSLTKKSIEQQNERELEESQKFTSENRKTLYEQIQEGNAKKEEEKRLRHQKKFVAHHIDETAQDFYKELREKEQAKQKEVKETLKQGLEEFQKEKQKKSGTVPSIQREQFKIVKKTTIKRKPKGKAKTKLAAYNSESD